MESTNGWTQTNVAPARATDGWLDRLFIEGHGDGPELADAIVQAAREVTEVRAGKQGNPYHVTVGRVWHIGEKLAEIRSDAHADIPVAFATDEIFAAGLRLGDAAVVGHEEIAPGVLLTTIERGLEQKSRLNPMTGQQMPVHVEALLDSQDLPARTNPVRRRLRFVA